MATEGSEEGDEGQESQLGLRSRVAVFPTMAAHLPACLLVQKVTGRRTTLHTTHHTMHTEHIATSIAHTIAPFPHSRAHYLHSHPLTLTLFCWPLCCPCATIMLERHSKNGLFFMRLLILSYISVGCTLNPPETPCGPSSLSLSISLEPAILYAEPHAN